MDNAMPDDEFADLQKCLRDHPMRHSNVNNEATFGATKGFIVSFSEEGIQELEKDKNFACLVPYFQRHRLPVANAWILNMVWGELAVATWRRPSGLLWLVVPLNASAGLLTRFPVP